MDLRALKAKLEALEGPNSGAVAPNALSTGLDYSPAYRQREDGSYVKPGVDDEDYQYDEQSYGKVLRPAKPPPLAPNYEELLRRLDVEELPAEIQKVEERASKLPAVSELQPKVSALQQQVQGLIQKLGTLLDRCRIVNRISPAYVVAEPPIEDYRLEVPPMAWRRDEDDAEVYHLVRESFRLYFHLQQCKLNLSNREALQANLASLERFRNRLEHDLNECAGLLSVIANVTELVQIVFSEAERSWVDEKAVYALDRAAVLDEHALLTKQRLPLRLTRKQDPAAIPCRSVLDVQLVPELPLDAPVNRLRLAVERNQSGPLFQDIAEASFQWVRVREMAESARQSIKDTDKTRSARRSAADAHYTAVREKLTRESLDIVIIQRTLPPPEL